MLELHFLLGRGLLLAGRIRQLIGNVLLARVDGGQYRFVQEALHQPYQDDEVQRLRTDGEPVNEHGHWPAGCAMAKFQNGLANSRIMETTKQ